MAPTERFEVELSQELAQFVHSQVGEGSLSSDADVMREAVRTLQRQAARLAELRAMVDAAINDPRPGVTADDAEAWLDQRALSYQRP